MQFEEWKESEEEIQKWQFEKEWRMHQEGVQTLNELGDGFC